MTVCQRVIGGLIGGGNILRFGDGRSVDIAAQLGVFHFQRPFKAAQAHIDGVIFVVGVQQGVHDQAFGVVLETEVELILTGAGEQRQGGEQKDMFFHLRQKL